MRAVGARIAALKGGRVEAVAETKAWEECTTSRSRQGHEASRK